MPYSFPFIRLQWLLLPRFKGFSMKLTTYSSYTQSTSWRPELPTDSLTAVSQRAAGKNKNTKRERPRRLNVDAWARTRGRLRWKMRWREREDWPGADAAWCRRPRSGLWGSAAVFSVISTAVWWSAGAAGGYRMSSVYSATWAQAVESQDVSLRGTIDPTVSVGGKAGRPDHIRATLRCHMSRVLWKIHHSGAENTATLDERMHRMYHNIKRWDPTTVDLKKICSLSWSFFWFLLGAVSWISYKTWHQKTQSSWPKRTKRLTSRQSSKARKQESC